MHIMAYDDRPEPAKRLQIAREAAKFGTAKAAALRFGWNKDSYYQHENGTRGIGRAAAKYAKAFKVSEAWLLTGEGQGPGEARKFKDPRLEELWLERPDIAAVVTEGIEQQIETAYEASGLGEKNDRKKQ
ncbi:putative phage repressor [Mesorhizobium alhagi CCNWXJ12-2]|uniref:Putative phage repressor n=2 Tax=Allomesorhizobium alhagi TaxID=475067 RepID=H0HQY1_9HYPH|nr:putative phage repressor [Mesorhizobium alhagi CCNWXJ12-2]